MLLVSCGCNSMIILSRYVNEQFAPTYIKEWCFTWLNTGWSPINRIISDLLQLWTSTIWKSVHCWRCRRSRCNGTKGRCKLEAFLLAARCLGRQHTRRGSHCRCPLRTSKPIIRLMSINLLQVQQKLTTPYWHDLQRQQIMPLIPECTYWVPSKKQDLQCGVANPISVLSRTGGILNFTLKCGDPLFIAGHIHTFGNWC